MKSNLLGNTITESIVTQGELMELASVVSQLQDENQMLWDKVHSTGQAMVQANKTEEHNKLVEADTQAEKQAMLEAVHREVEEHHAIVVRCALYQLTAVQLEAETQLSQAKQEIERERAMHHATKAELARVQQLASQEDEATLKGAHTWRLCSLVPDHRRRLTEELLDVESKLVGALEEREQLKRLLEGDVSVQVDREYWASAMALLLERAQLHENQSLLAAQCQEGHLQNKALASQVLVLEDKLVQAQTALNAWNALNAH